jgi:hypothetical protein
MRNIRMVITLAVMSFPTAAFAQVNYVLLPGFYTGAAANNNNTYTWAAVIVSYKDGKVYWCEVKLKPPANPTIHCNPQSFAGTVLQGPNVVTTSPRGVGTTEGPIVTDFWQLDQQTGEVQLCKTAGTKAGCVKYQLP